MTLRFEYPWVLFLLWLVPAAGGLWYLTWRSARSAVQAFVAPAMAGKLAPPTRFALQHWQWGCLLTGLTLALVAAARPQWGMREETVYQRGRDLLVALDVSRSMLARDVHPSRLGRAKVDLMDLVKQLDGDRVGLITFRGKAVLLCPLTTDYNFLLQVLDDAGLQSAPPGETDLGDALEKALEAFRDDEGPHKAVVLISDGEDLAGRSSAMAEKARDKGITVFTVGLGSTEGAAIPAPDRAAADLQYQGKDVVTKLSNETLRQIAEKTGGAYVPVGVANVRLGSLYRDHLARITARDLSESVRRRYIERYQIFLLPAVLCFLAALFLSRGQPGGRNSKTSGLPAAHAGSTPPTLPPQPPPIPTSPLALFVALALGAHAASAATNAMPAAAPRPEKPAAAGAGSSDESASPRVAQALYLAGQYARAAEEYRAAARAATPAARSAYLYNSGCAAFKAGNFQAAAAAFRDAEDVGEGLPRHTAYNLGTALLRGGEHASATATNAEQAADAVDLLQKASSALQRGLRTSPDQPASLQNLQAASAQFPDVQQKAKLLHLMQEYGQVPPSALADQVLQGQRQLSAGMPAAFTNAAPARITALEQLGATQEELADRLIPLQMALSAAMSGGTKGQDAKALQAQQQQAAAVNRQLTEVGDRMRQTADALRDLDPAAYAASLRQEEAVYPLWKALAEYPMLLGEDLYRQTNAIALTAPNVTGATDALLHAIRKQQDESLDLTQRFTERFAASVPEGGLPMPAPSAPPAATNREPGTNAVQMLITPETRRKILDLAGQATAVQSNAMTQVAAAALTEALPSEQEAYRLLEEIQKLLPSQSQSQQEQKEQKQQPQKQPQPQENQPQPQKQPQEPPPPKEDMAKTEAQKLIDKAKQREKEHQDELRERENYMPPSPIERDW